MNMRLACLYQSYSFYRAHGHSAAVAYQWAKNDEAYFDRIITENI